MFFMVGKYIRVSLNNHKRMRTITILPRAWCGRAKAAERFLFCERRTPKHGFLFS
jgi:hypothetical protein